MEIKNNNLPYIIDFSKIGSSEIGYISVAEKEFILDTPNQGLYMPKYCWHTMKYDHNSVQMCIASMEYEEKDYIRDYNDFKSIIP